MGYNPELGVWLQRDPVDNGPNPYDYCKNNPINATDPSGMTPVTTQPATTQRATSQLGGSQTRRAPVSEPQLPSFDGPVAVQQPFVPVRIPIGDVVQCPPHAVSIALWIYGDYKDNQGMRTATAQSRARYYNEDGLGIGLAIKLNHLSDAVLTIRNALASRDGKVKEVHVMGHTGAYTFGKLQGETTGVWFGNSFIGTFSSTIGSKWSDPTGPATRMDYHDLSDPKTRATLEEIDKLLGKPDWYFENCNIDLWANSAVQIAKVLGRPINVYKEGVYPRPQYRYPVTEDEDQQIQPATRVVVTPK